MIGHRLRTCALTPSGELDVKLLNYGAWIGGVYHVPSHQLFRMNIVQDGENINDKQMVPTSSQSDLVTNIEDNFVTVSSDIASILNLVEMSVAT